MIGNYHSGLVERKTFTYNSRCIVPLICAHNAAYYNHLHRIAARVGKESRGQKKVPFLPQITNRQTTDSSLFSLGYIQSLALKLHPVTPAVCSYLMTFIRNRKNLFKAHTTELRCGYRNQYGKRGIPISRLSNIEPLSLLFVQVVCSHLDHKKQETFVCTSNHSLKHQMLSGIYLPDPTKLHPVVPVVCSHPQGIIF